MPPIILRIILIVFGILLFVCAMLSYAGKKLKEGFLLGWCLFALFFILAGISPALSLFPRPSALFSGLAQMISPAFLVLFLFKISEYVSVLSRKNQELAMQVSLLNQENERILTELQQLTGKNKTEL